MAVDEEDSGRTHLWTPSKKWLAPGMIRSCRDFTIIKSIYKSLQKFLIMEFVGKPIQCKAAVAWAPNEPLRTELITVDPPKVSKHEVVLCP